MTENFIIHASARQYQWKGESFLSVKSFYNGVAKYQIQHREYQVTEQNFLVLNDCTQYHLTIDHPVPTESFCVFFSPEFVSQTVTALKATDKQLLDLSMKKEDGFSLVERNYPHVGGVSNILWAGRQSEIDKRSTLEKEEYYHGLLAAIYCQNRHALKEAEQLSFKKSSTRAEIYRRVYYAKDFIDANFTQDLTLRKIATVAMLSENHLLRNFTQVFRISPFNYIVRLKMEAAKRQIVDTDRNISEIAMTLGYSSMSNFSHYFKRVVGVSPLAFRKKVMHRKS